MKDVSKKRRASVSDDSDAGTSHKKSKTSSAPAGKDEEGNPYWDVSLLVLASLALLCSLAPC